MKKKSTILIAGVLAILGASSIYFYGFNFGTSNNAYWLGKSNISNQSIESSKQALEKLLEGNKSSQDINDEIRKDTAENGQKPYAVVVACSDSRVSPEIIFDTNLGELFVIRTAGNVVSDLELGSIEYGVEHLGAKTVVVLGHSNCGAVAAAIEGKSHGNIQAIVDKIKPVISDEKDASVCEDLNIENVKNEILKSEILKNFVDSEDVSVVKMKYDILSGKVTQLESSL